MSNHLGYIYLLASMYLAGLIGLSIEGTRSLFQALTPFHLLTSFGILVLFQKDKSPAFVIFLFICVFTGYFIEVAGVKTGLIFGRYEYLTTLGLKILEVPPMIGINWFLLVFCVGTVIEKWQQNIWLKTTAGSLALTLFDFVAEPVAISQSMWTWFGTAPPLQNYIAWFFVAFFLLYLFFRSGFRKENPVAPWLLVFQVVFFGILSIAMRLS
jgi:putative membrane protein